MKQIIENLIKEYIKGYSSLNSVETRWEEPLIAFADALDPLFSGLKAAVSPTHALPTDFLSDAKTVITFFIPFEKSVVSSNAGGRECSRTWAVAYIETNKLIVDLNLFLRDQLASRGFKAAVIPPTHNFDEKKLISDWSHRHAAYIAGLGSFGLNNMLITEKGCCGRVGSLITNAEIEPAKREKTEFCLYKRKGICKKCIDRCVNSALKVDSFDRHKCYEMCLYNDKLHSDIGLSDVCGKCLVNVPCSFVNPSGKEKIT